MKQITPQEEIDKYLKSSVEELINETIYKLSYIGENVVNTARLSGEYLDQTGNLSSIGYIISVDGEIIRQGEFNVVKDGENGTKSGEALAQALAKTSKGITLIVVAGMHYAIYVSAKGLDVLDSAEIELENNYKNNSKMAKTSKEILQDVRRLLLGSRLQQNLSGNIFSVVKTDQKIARLRMS